MNEVTVTNHTNIWGRRSSRMKIGCKVDVGMTKNNKETLIVRTERPKGRVIESEGWKSR